MHRQSGVEVLPPAGQRCELSLPALTAAAACCALQIMHRETVRDVADLTGAAITTRGVYVPPGHRLPEGERKLYLLIQVRLPLRELCSPPPGCLCSAFHVSQCWSPC